MTVPTSYNYISRRRTRELVLAARGEKHAKRLSGLQFDVTVLGAVGLSKKDLFDGANDVQLALMAEKITSSSTRNTSNATGEGFLGYRGPLRMESMRYTQPGMDRFRVAWMAAERDDLLLVLCGSSKNYLITPADELAPGAVPSSPEGMEAFVKSELGADDPDDVTIGEVDVQELAEVAASHTRRAISDDALRHAPLRDVLCETYGVAQNVVAFDPRRGAREYATVIVGAPLWVREPRYDRPQPGGNP